jgi:hypothetical protein
LVKRVPEPWRREAFLYLRELKLGLPALNASPFI